MEYFLHIGILICIFLILSISYNLIMGYARLFSLAHGAMFGVGAYASALFAVGTKAGILYSMLVAACVTAAMGAVIGFPALRVKSYYLAVLSLGFQQVVNGLMVNLLDFTGGESGMGGIPRPKIFGGLIQSKWEYFLFMFIIVVLFFVLAKRLTTSPFGRVIKALRDDEEAVRAIGKNVLYFKVAIFMFSGAMAGIAGSLYAHYVTFINPTSFTFIESVFIISMVVFGGTGNLWGSVVGAVILVTVPELTRFIRGFSEGIVGPLRVVLYGAMLIIMIRFRPQGIIPEYSKSQTTRNDKDFGMKTRERHAAEGLNFLSHSKIFDKNQGDSTKGKEIILSATKLSKHFGGIQAVQDLNMQIEKGKITALIGPNGAGKTTFFNLVTGVISPDSGEIRYKDKNVMGLRPHQTTQFGFSRTFQEVRLFPRMTVSDTVMVARPKQKGENIFLACIPSFRQEKINRDYSMQILDFVGLIHRRNELAENLSYAEQKLLSLARLLATNTELLLLDEPTSGLDHNSMETILGLIKSLPQFGKTVCIVEHNLDVIREVSDWVYFLAEGHVIKEGTPDAIFSDPKLAEIYFGGGSAFWDWNYKV